MPSLERFFDPQIRKFDLNIKSLPGARFYFFQNGSTTPKTVYQDKAGETPHTNPVIADSNGSFAPIFLDGLYRVELRSNANIVQPGWPIDNVGQDSAIVPFGPWVEIVTYNEGEVVTGSNGNWYRSIGNDNLGNNPISSPSEWEVIPIPIASSFTSDKAYLTWSDDGDQISLDVDIQGLSADAIAHIKSEIAQPASDLTIGGDLEVDQNVLINQDLDVLGQMTIGTPLAVISGGTSASTAADARTNLGLNTAAVQEYNSQSVALNGDFSGFFVVDCTRLADMVTISTRLIATHTNLPAPASSAGLIPLIYRPAVNASNVFYMSVGGGGLIACLNILSDGTLTIEYSDFAGVGVSRTSLPSIASISYSV